MEYTVSKAGLMSALVVALALAGSSIGLVNVQSAHAAGTPAEIGSASQSSAKAKKPKAVAADFRCYEPDWPGKPFWARVCVLRNGNAWYMNVVAKRSWTKSLAAERGTFNNRTWQASTRIAGALGGPLSSVCGAVSNTCGGMLSGLASWLSPRVVEPGWNDLQRASSSNQCFRFQLSLFPARASNIGTSSGNPEWKCYA